MIKSYKIRIYPTKDQEAKIWQHIGASRYIWNYMLALQENRFKAGERHLSAFDMNNLLKPLKNDGEHEWMHNVSNKTLCRSCADLSSAYDGFFRKKSGHPKFKSRKQSKPNYPARGDTFYFENGFVNIEKIGHVKYKTDFILPIGRSICKYSNVRVSYVNNKWMVSFGIERENQMINLTDTPMGIDLGVKDLSIVAFGEQKLVFHNINKSYKMRAIDKKRRHLQRSISRKYNANRQDGHFIKTSNIVRQENELRRIYARQSNIRTNYIHQITHRLVSLHPYVVTMEDLNVSGMMKNLHLSKAIAQQKFYEFIRQMQYKCEWNGIKFVQADRFYPSSKTCSCCGSVKSDLKLSDRTFICPMCGFTIDRDYNAAINLMRYGA